MDHAWSLSKAKAEDAGTIASLFAQSWTTPFTRLQFGHVDPVALVAAMIPRITQQIELTNVAIMGIRDPHTEEVVSIAQWTLPDNDTNAVGETQEEAEERQMFEDEVYRSTLPENSNKDLIMEFTIGLRSLKRQVLGGQKHYALENLATHPQYRRQGLASRLVRSVFSLADAADVPVYLETDSNSQALPLYQRLGFEERGHHTIGDLNQYVKRRELEVYGGHMEHTHVALIRYPKPAHSSGSISQSCTSNAVRRMRPESIGSIVWGEG